MVGTGLALFLLLGHSLSVVVCLFLSAGVVCDASLLS